MRLVLQRAPGALEAGRPPRARRRRRLSGGDRRPGRILRVDRYGGHHGIGDSVARILRGGPPGAGRRLADSLPLEERHRLLRPHRPLLERRLDERRKLRTHEGRRERDRHLARRGLEGAHREAPLPLRPRCHRDLGVAHRRAGPRLGRRRLERRLVPPLRLRRILGPRLHAARQEPRDRRRASGTGGRGPQGRDPGDRGRGPEPSRLRHGGRPSHLPARGLPRWNRRGLPGVDPRTGREPEQLERLRELRIDRVAELVGESEAGRQRTHDLDPRRRPRPVPRLPQGRDGRDHQAALRLARLRHRGDRRGRAAHAPVPRRSASTS
jgi:hypothetical protein